MDEAKVLKIALPKGRMQEGVFRLLSDAGLPIKGDERDYRPRLPSPDLDAKILKPRNTLEMLHAGTRDLGFAGSDWVEELGVELTDMLDTGLDPVRLVAAAPVAILEDGRLPRRPLVVASEYENIARRWIAGRDLDATFVRSYGATEVFPPDDADCIVDNTATGSTLRANGLEIVDELLRSSTRLYANPRSLEDPWKRDTIEAIVLLLRSVLTARSRVMLELNVDTYKLDSVIAILPCMREPTVSPLRGGDGYAVKVAAPRDSLAALIPEIRRRGGTDIIVTQPMRIVP
ncbi:MAG TPA: ATP phosphoribosyltransferase [Spirochaetia bacterium]|nr:ATP phosphoribosyltransferase [Spirochaetales bacterium]HRY80629.1 ATP phosphoribosyltransferase [Spirochaetia bacterium]HRZ89694.1 ATP phosphoribosyltransferase [Spirochaetia bacterium]